ncbi:MAG: sugar phosphate isomerase/epimerase family protein [Verrucomicrobiales bacterium]
MKFAICNEIFRDWNIDEIFRYAASLGYEGVEIAPFTIAKSVLDIPQSRRAQIRDAAARNKIAITGIHWVLVQTEGLHLTDPDTKVREATSQYFTELVKFCADIGGKTIVVGSPRQRSLKEGVSFEQGWDWATEVFRQPVNVAEDKGVTICFESLAAAETNFINTAEQSLKFVQQLQSPHFKVILDVKAMCSEKKPIPQIVAETGVANLGYFHANDANLKGPGFGSTDFVPIARALKQIGYSGFVSVEVFNFDEGPHAIAERSLAYLKKTFCSEQSADPS